MKALFIGLIFLLTKVLCLGQCAAVGVQVSSSDTTNVQLYNAGIFLIPSGFDNVCEWDVLSFSGDTIYEEVTSGEFAEQSFVIFDHEIPLTDSMYVTIVITNNTEGIICTMSDTLYWKETEILPGAFIGNWDVLSNNGGVEEDISTSVSTFSVSQNIEVFPSPSFGQFWVRSNMLAHSFTIFSTNGEVVANYNNVSSDERIDISQCASGVYVIHFWDDKRNRIGVKKIIKQ